jgi:hypothetical protein
VEVFCVCGSFVSGILAEKLSGKGFDGISTNFQKLPLFSEPQISQIVSGCSVSKLVYMFIIISLIPVEVNVAHRSFSFFVLPQRKKQRKRHFCESLRTQKELGCVMFGLAKPLFASSA